jgi:hypothetical protein
MQFNMFWEINNQKVQGNFAIRVWAAEVFVKYRLREGSFGLITLILI